MENIIALYTAHFGAAPLHAELLPGAGSNRKYARLTAADGTTIIGAEGPSVAENRCFIFLSRHFTTKGLPVPEIVAVSSDGHCYLQRDLGTLSLYDALKRGREAGGQYDEDEKALISRTIKALAHIQVEGARELDFDRCLPPVRFDKMAVMFDLNYFKYCFLRTTQVTYDEVALQTDLERFADDLVSRDANLPATFLYRDFQARNVMLHPAPDGSLSPAFIDFQGGMEGPLQYDVASFLYQASARYPKALREEMVETYLDELTTLLPTLSRIDFKQRLRLFVLFRLLQVLGAYGLRGRFERKPYFLRSIPEAIKSLSALLREGICSVYPYLEATLRDLVALPELAPLPQGTASHSKHEGQGALHVDVFSFSYKKGIPADTSGNGGGYVFDCRSTHNPGRYEPYKQLTGLDRPVIDFLEQDGEIIPFLAHATALVDAHVERFLKRGFTHLQVSFGCTGGQHRSVYSAQHLAQHLHEKYGISVTVTHREQGIQQQFG